jgi:hypothetical protein
MAIVYIKYKAGQAMIIPAGSDNSDRNDDGVHIYMIGFMPHDSRGILFKWSDYSFWTPVERSEDAIGRNEPDNGLNIGNDELNLEEYAKHVISKLNAHDGKYDSVTDSDYKYFD